MIQSYEFMEELTTAADGSLGMSGTTPAAMYMITAINSFTPGLPKHLIGMALIGASEDLSVGQGHGPTHHFWATSG